MITEILNSSNKDLTVQRVVKFLNNGEIVAVPTETVYGLACDFSNSLAIQKLYNIKGRNYNKPFQIAVASIDEVAKYALDLPSEFYILANAFLPGPLSFILKKQELVPDILTSNLDTVNIRILDNEISNSILKEFGKPLALTSANLSGNKSCLDAHCVLQFFNRKIAAVVDDGICKVGLESTIISLISTKPKIIRQGAISIKEIENVLGYSIDSDL